MSTTASRAPLAMLHGTYDPAIGRRDFTDQFVTDSLSQHMTSAVQTNRLARAQRYRGDDQKTTHPRPPTLRLSRRHNAPGSGRGRPFLS